MQTAPLSTLATLVRPLAVRFAMRLIDERALILRARAEEIASCLSCGRRQTSHIEMHPLASRAGKASTALSFGDTSRRLRALCLSGTGKYNRRPGQLDVCGNFRDHPDLSAWTLLLLLSSSDHPGQAVPSIVSGTMSLCGEPHHRPLPNCNSQLHSHDCH